MRQRIIKRALRPKPYLQKESLFLTAVLNFKNSTSLRLAIRTLTVQEISVHETKNISREVLSLLPIN